MPPQFVDLDADGHIDIVTAAYEGFAYLIRGTKDGFFQPEKLRNENGDSISFRETRLTSVTTTDWDHDGDQDLIVGNSGTGTLYLVENCGTRSEPKFSSKFSTLMMGGGSGIRVIDITNVVACDWNKDGLVDLICGSHDDGVFLFENEGTKRTPLYWNKVRLVAPFRASVTIGTEPGNQEAKVAYFVDGTFPCASYTVSVVDYDLDGELDLLVGCNASVKVEKKLSSSQKSQLEAYTKELEDLGKKMNGPEALETHTERYNELSGLIWKLEMLPIDLPMIWVFQRDAQTQKR